MSLAMPRRSRLLLVSTVAAAALILAGCSTPSPSETDGPAEGSTVDPHSPEQSSLTAVGYRQTSAAPWYAAIDAGYTEDFGLTDLEYQFGENSPAILTSIVGGSGQVGQVSLPSVIDAVSQGIDVVIVGEAYREPTDSQLMLTLSGSGIESIEDLHGKKVGLVGLNSGQHNRLRYVMQLEDIDYSDIEFVNLTYGEMSAALQTGAIDAGVFTGAVLQDARANLDVTEVFDFGGGPLKEISALQWVATAEWAAANPNTVAAFQCAVVYKGEQLVQDDDEAYYSAMENPDLGFSRDVLSQLPKIIYPAANDAEAMQLNAKIQFAVGLSPEEFDVSSIVIPLPTNCDE